VTETGGGVTGYEPIETPFSTEHWGGLEYNGGSALLDGSVEYAVDGEVSNNWYYAVGSRAEYYGEIPGANENEDQVELYALSGAASGPAGVLVTSTVPVWAVLEDLRTDDEQILYGAFV
jgi:hypothetical protein